MNTNENNLSPSPSPLRGATGYGAEEEVGDHNVAQLLGQAYQPDMPDPAFLRRVEERMLATARELAHARAAKAPLPWQTNTPTLTLPQARGRERVGVEELGRINRRVAWAVTAAAVLGGVALFLQLLAGRNGEPRHQGRSASYALRPSVDMRRAEHLSPRPRPPSPVEKPIAVGQEFRTEAGQRRRVALSDGSVVYLNQKTRIKLAGERRLTVSAGEAYIEVSPRGERQATFVVETSGRNISALGTKFFVRADEKEVVVTQGKVRVDGSDQLVAAGQRVDLNTQTVSAAPRASYLLDWAKDLMAAAESPLVPASQYAGGALVAIDPYGQEAKLSLRKYHVDVHIENGFARTTIDQTYFNADPWRMEGTFYFPLPPDASLSRLAMYVDGQRMEGGMAERDYARQVFETIVTRQKDPALLEWVDGSTFKMRVFPLEGRQEKRIILSYTQRLPLLYDRLQYRFPAGHNLAVVGQWSFHARVKNGLNFNWNCLSHDLHSSPDSTDLVLDADTKSVKLDRDVALELHGNGLGESARFSSAELEHAKYLMVRYRPNLPGMVKRQRRDWVFLFESSGDRDPLLARVQVDVIRAILANAEHDDTFAIVTAGTRVHTFPASEGVTPSARLVSVAPENVQAGLDFLEHTHLVGALDLGNALSAAVPFLKGASVPCLVHLGSGIPALGERREEELLRCIPEQVPYIGVGVGKRWSRSFMKRGAERGDGYFTQINPDEPIAWRAFELVSTLNAPRLLNVKVVDDAEQLNFLPYANSIAQGEELCALARIDPAGKATGAVPKSVTITGTLEGKPYVRVIPVDHVDEHADYLPRTWAKLEIDRLLSESSREPTASAEQSANEPLKAKIIALSKSMYVMTPFTSLLVLENEEMYKQYKVDRGRKDHWAMYPCPEKIPVVYEPDPFGRVDWRNPPKGGSAEQKSGARKPVDEVLRTILVRNPPGFSHRLRSMDHFAEVEEYFDGDPYIFSATGPRGVVRFNFNRGVELGKGLGVVNVNEIDPRRVVVGLQARGRFTESNDIRLITAGQDDNGVLNGSMGIDAANFDNNGPFLFSVHNYSVIDYDSDDAPSLFPYPRHWRTLAGHRPAFASVTDGTSNTLMIGEKWSYAPSHALTHWSILDSIQDGVGLVDVKTWRMANALGYYPPSRSLVVRGTSGIHTSLGGGLMAPRIPGKVNIHVLRDPQLVHVAFADGSLHNIRYGIDPDVFLALSGSDAEKETEGPLSFQLGAFVQECDFDTKDIAAHFSKWPLYQRPSFSFDDRVFHDLASYAPGLNTSAADIQAILEAEAQSDTPSATGQIDAKARDLIDKARGSGWQTVTFPDFKITFDGAGRYAFKRTLPTGLYEGVVCDGRTLWHLYPELGLGAKRTVSRFHRAEFSAVMPGTLPPAEDLARDADLRSIDEHTVAVVPHPSAGLKRGRSQAEPGNEAKKPKATYEIRLIFSADGRLAERRIVQMPGEKVLARETFSLDGVVRVLDGDGKVLTTVRRALAPGKEPDLKPDLSKLVVVPMPLRTGEQSDKSGTTNEESAISLLAAQCLQQDGSALQLFKQRFHARGDRRLGFYTLLISGRMGIEPFYFEEERPPSALRKYLANCDETIRIGQRGEIGAIGGPPDGLIQRLAAFRDLGKKWQTGPPSVSPPSVGGRYGGGRSAAERRAEVERALDFVRRNKSSPFGWPMLSLIQDKIGDGKQDQLALAEACRLFENVPYLAYPARYERARCLLNAGHSEEARTVFLGLYEETLKVGVVPPIDRAFAEALRPLTGAARQEGANSISWAELMRRTSAGLVADHRRLQALTLAWQSRLIGNQSLADDLLAQAMAHLDDKERFVTSLAGIDYLIQTGQPKKAEKLLEPLLEAERYAKFSGLWRLAAWLGFLRENNARAASYLDRALDLEYAHLPEVIDLAAVRRDYSRLLEQYLEVASELAKSKASAPRDFLTKVIRAGDRWRALDSDPTGACFVTARILKTLGMEDLAWEYLTTPVGLRPNEAGPWLDLARALAQTRDRDWVDRAYRGAFEAEPSNAQVLWDQAKNLQEAGKTPEARKLFQRIADGDWQPRFDDLKKEARRQLEP